MSNRRSSRSTLTRPKALLAAHAELAERVKQLESSPRNFRADLNMIQRDDTKPTPEVQTLRVRVRVGHDEIEVEGPATNAEVQHFSNALLNRLHEILRDRSTEST